MADLTAREEAAVLSVIRDAIRNPARFAGPEPGDLLPGPAWQARAVLAALIMLGWTISRRPQETT